MAIYSFRRSFNNIFNQWNKNTCSSKGEIIAAGNLGKYKTTSQMLVVIVALAIGPIGFYISDYFFTVAEVLMLIPVILTIWSGWEYTFKAKHYFTEQ